VLHVVDTSDTSTTANNPAVDKLESLKVLTLYNKSDIAQHLALEETGSGFYISAKARDGIDKLLVEITRLLSGGSTNENILLTRARHAECLQGALQNLTCAADSFSEGVSADLVMVDLREAIIQLGEIIGERLDEQILDRIFSTFCLGK
jgi:tRNA modification GTPase